MRDPDNYSGKFIYLNSNMDRIQCTGRGRKLLKKYNLNSNMDRIQSGAGVQCALFEAEFKFQYG